MQARRLLFVMCVLVGVLTLVGAAMLVAASQSDDSDLFHTMPSALAFSHDGRYLACGGRDGTVSLWEINDSGEATSIGRLHEYFAPITSVAFSADRDWLATGDGGGRIYVWNLEDRLILRALEAGQVRSVAFSPDSQLLIAGTRTGTWAWRMEDGHRLTTRCDLSWWAGGCGDGAWSLAVLPDGRGTLATVPFGQWITRFVCDPPSSFQLSTPIEWGADTSWDVERTPSEDDSWWGLALSPTDPWIAAGSMSGEIAVWEITGDGLGQRVKRLTGHEGRVDSLDFSPSGTLLLSGAWDQTVRLWDVVEGRLLATFRETGDAPYCIGTFSPCGRYLAVSTAAGRVLIIRVLDGEVASLVDHRAKMTSLSFTHVDRETADRSRSHANEKWDWFQNEEAIDAFEEASKIYHRVGLTAEEAGCLRDIGTCWYQIEEYEKASDAYGRALAFFHTLEDEGNVSFCAYWLLDSCFHVPNAHLFASYAEAVAARVDALQRAVEQLRSAGEQLLEAQAWRRLGLDYYMADQPDDAVRSYREAARLYGELGDVDREADAVVAGCGSIADQAERVSCLEAALTGFREGDTPTGEAKALKSLGLAYDALGRHDEAIDSYRQAAGVYFAIEDYLASALAIRGAGSILKALERYEEAIDHLTPVLAVLRGFENEPLVREHLSWTLMDLGDCHLALEQCTEALSTYEVALAVGDTAGHGLISFTIRPRWGMGRCYWAMGELDRARESYEAAIEDAEAWVAGEDRETFRQSMMDVSLRRLYEEYIALLSELEDTATMLPASERCRARTFLDLLAAGPSGTLTNVTEAGISSGAVDTNALLGDVAAAIDRLPPETAVLEYFVSEETTYVWVIRSNEISGPFYLPLSRSALIDQVMACRKALENPEETVAAYHLAGLYASLVGPVETHLPQVLGEEIPHLIIVPSGPLHYLPFQALLRAGEGERSHAYLIERFTLSYAPSLASLNYTAFGQPAQGGLPDDLVAFIDPYAGDAQYGLASAQGEAAWIRDRLPQASIFLGESATEEAVQSRAAEATYLLFSTHGIFDPDDPLQSYLMLAPTETIDGALHAHEVFSLGVQADLVILSACETLLPAVAREEANERSRRGLAEDAEVTLPQERLLQLTAGEEVVGLTRAFLSTGTRSLVASLWNVYDAPTAGLVRELLSGLLDNTGKASALRTAQLAILAATPHPAYWAAFNLVGDWR